MQMNTQYLTRREYDESFLENDLRNEYCHVIPPRLSRIKAVRISRTAFLLPIGGREFREQHQLEVVERPVLA